jgi:hypothetical protein
MSRCVGIAAVWVCCIGLSGCRCTPCFNRYGDMIDGVTDFDILFDREYYPRRDISRGGRPDWCGPINAKICRCRCQYGTWDRYDECWIYPPTYPYQYPGNSLYNSVAPAGAEESSLPDIPELDTTTHPAEPEPVPARSSLIPAPPPPGTVPPPPVPPEAFRSRPGFEIQ